MEGVLDRVGFFVENSINFEGPPEVIGLGSGSIKGRGLFPSQVSFVVDRGSYGGLSGNWWSGHSGNLSWQGRRYLDLGWCYWR